MREVEWLLKGTPREVQLEALRRSYYGYSLMSSRDDQGTLRILRDGGFSVGWGHFLEMRLGKTPTTLNEIMLFNYNQGIKKGVIFAPNTYKGAWVSEAEEFGVTLPFFAYDTSDRVNVLKRYKKENAGYLVVNYEGLVQQGTLDVIMGAMGNDRFVVALDESIAIKNNTSLYSKKAREIAKEASVVRLLTGLPMTQGPHDLYAQLRAIRQIEGTNYFAFRNRFCKMGGFKNKKVVGVQNEGELNQILSDCSFTAKLRDWGQYEEPNYHVEKLTPLPEQILHYRNMERDFITFLESGEEITAAHAMTKMMKQQQISSGFMYDEDGNTHWICDPRKLPKLERLFQILEETNKLVVYYHYNASADMLEEQLAKYKPTVIRSQEIMSKRGLDIAEEKRKFNNDPEHRVMLAQMQRTKYGHDLTGNKSDVVCNNVAYYENTFSLDTRSQTEMRIVTAFQTLTPNYLDFVSFDTDKSFVTALQAKRSLYNAVMEPYGRK